MNQSQIRQQCIPLFYLNHPRFEFFHLKVHQVDRHNSQHARLAQVLKTLYFESYLVDYYKDKEP